MKMATVFSSDIDSFLLPLLPAVGEIEYVPGWCVVMEPAALSRTSTESGSRRA